MSGHPGQVETERLLLVPWSDQYFDEFARICADGDVMHFISGGEALSRQDVEQILRRTRSMWDEYGFGPWAAIDKDSGRWIGRIGLNLLAGTRQLGSRVRTCARFLGTRARYRGRSFGDPLWLGADAA